MAVGEVFPAVTAARKAVELDPLWWVAHQTLGRAHMGLGEVRTVSLFLRSVFSSDCIRVWKQQTPLAP